MLALSSGMRPATSRTGTLALLGVSALAAVAASGCSFVFVDGPPATAKSLPVFTCTTSNALPTTDVVLAGLFALSAIENAAHATGSYSSNEDAVAAGVFAAAFATSAFVGYSRTSDCREATADLMKRLYQGAPGQGFSPYAPGPYPPPPAYDPWTAPAPGAGFAPPGPAPVQPVPGAPPAGAAPPPAGAAPPPAGAAPPPAGAAPPPAGAAPPPAPRPTPAPPPAEAKP
jgi:hypothetical protein